MPQLLQIRTSRPQEIRGKLTSYGKQPRDGRVWLSFGGLDDDEVANKQAHGGPDKAVLAWSVGNYPLWIADHPQHAAQFAAGAFGENLLIKGLSEESVCIGDRWRVGDALLEICQPRRPCATVAHWFNDPAMLKAMVQTRRTGWYLRVLEEGFIEPGEIIVEASTDTRWTVARTTVETYRTPVDAAELRHLALAPALAAGWVERVLKLAANA